MSAMQMRGRKVRKGDVTKTDLNETKRNERRIKSGNPGQQGSMQQARSEEEEEEEEWMDGWMDTRLPRCSRRQKEASKEGKGTLVPPTDGRR